VGELLVHRLGEEREDPRKATVALGRAREASIVQPLAEEVVMSELRVRNMDDWILAELKAQAKAHGRSLEAELRERLLELALRPRQEMAERAARLRGSIAKEHGLLPDSAASIRQERDGRG
jgi:antitoxin FitA